MKKKKKKKSYGSILCRTEICATSLIHWLGLVPTNVKAILTITIFFLVVVEIGAEWIDTDALK